MMGADRTAGLRTVFVIRHAEKPDEGPHLSELGAERARALAGLFDDCFCPPDALFAAADKPESHRPRETLEPLSAALGLPIDAGFKTHEVDRLAERLRGADAPPVRVALVSWRHDDLPALAHALGAHDTPATWPEHVYDRVWRLLYDADGSVRFADLAQGLMPRDARS